MGLFSSIKDSFNPFSGGGGGLGSLLGGGNPLSGQRSPIQNEQNEVADRAIERGQAAADLQRERAGILREDAEPLRELRNDNINRLLKLQGIGQEQDISSFYSSPEFTSVRDAALQVQGNNPRQNIS